MLSLNKGDRKLALVCGGKYNNKILKLYEPKKVSFDEESNSDNEEYENDNMEQYITDEFFKKELKGRMTREMKYEKILPIRDALKSGISRTLPKELKKVYEKANKQIRESAKTEFKLSSGKLIPLPQKFESGSEHGYVAGPSGSGKSTYIGNYISMFKKQHKGAQVWVFSRVDEDAPLDAHKVNRILLDDGLLESPIDPVELSGGKPTLVIFDDIDTIRDQAIREEVLRLRDDILETGRHDNITSISTSHQLMDYKKTRTILNESKFVTIFPKSGSVYHIKRMLKEYVGLEKHMIQKILNLPSRWVTVYKVAPMLVLYETGCFLIN